MDQIKALLFLVYLLLVSTLASDCQPSFHHNILSLCESSCFPQDASIITKARGTIKMNELEIGDEVLTIKAGCSDCESFYTQVTGWLHKDPDIRSEYLEIVDQNQHTFFVSPMHNLATDHGDYVFAKNAGNVHLFGWNTVISKILRVQKKGAYAPMTESGTYFVLKSNGDKVLAHCFSNVANPTAYESIVRLALKLHDKILGVSNEKVHPVASWLMKGFSFLYEQE